MKTSTRNKQLQITSLTRLIVNILLTAQLELIFESHRRKQTSKYLNIETGFSVREKTYTFVSTVYWKSLGTVASQKTWSLHPN